MEAPSIPARISSQRAVLEGKKRQFDKESEEIVKRIKVRPSVDMELWAGIKDAEAKNLESVRLHRKVSMLALNLEGEGRTSRLCSG